MLIRWRRLHVPRGQLALKVIGLTFLSVSLTIVYFAVVSYYLEHAAEEERFGMALERIAATAALSLDGDAHRGIRSAADAQRPEFLRMREFLRRVQRANSLGEDQIYTFQPPADPQRASRLQFAVMLQERSFVGDGYTVVEKNLPALQKALTSRAATHTKLYRDAHGAWVSGYAPIFDSRGELAGVLEVDYRIDVFIAAINAKVRRLVLISLCALVLSLILSWLLATRLHLALRLIRRAAEAIQHEDYTIRIELDRSDELGMVAQQFNRMAETLSERFHMLKYLPQHTLDAIARRDRGVALTTERLHAAVMFTDIRGYTALSTELTDEGIVAMLNLYLRRQAEIIDQHNGVIDKFIGDAVLALFAGADGSRRAVQAALEIRKAILDLNAAAVFPIPVHIGLGISVGELVLGEIGSEDRRERTPIGSIVNLASRLGSRAGSEEIMVSDGVRRELGDSLEIEATLSLQLKGFAEEQSGHLVRGLASR